MPDYPLSIGNLQISNQPQPEVGEIYNDDISALVGEGDLEHTGQNWKYSDPSKSHLS
jgi:hypothetical protein